MISVVGALCKGRSSEKADIQIRLITRRFLTASKDWLSTSWRDLLEAIWGREDRTFSRDRTGETSNVSGARE